MLTGGQCPLEISFFGVQEKETLPCENNLGRADIVFSPAKGQGTATSPILGIAPLLSQGPRRGWEVGGYSVAAKATSAPITPPGLKGVCFKYLLSCHIHSFARREQIFL